MSDNIPIEIQEEIMKRLPVKSIIQFRSVSKPWKSLIDSSEFIANYHHTQTQHRLLVSYTVPQDHCNHKCVSFVDDDSFPQHKFTHTLPVSVQQLQTPTNSIKTPSILYGSQGLFCFYNFNVTSDYPPTSMAVIWNPAIRKSVDVVVPNVFDNPSSCITVLGFGVCPHTNDPKLVKATYATYISGNDNFPWEIQVFTLSSGVWRSTKSSNLPTSFTRLAGDDNVVIDGFIYWPAYEKIMVDGESKLNCLIMSFDLTKEEFAKVYLPDSLLISWGTFSLSKLRNSLVVLQSRYEQGVLLNWGVWMMENGDPKSFTNTFTIDPPDASISMVLGFRKSGETIVVREEEHNAFFVYEHDSEQTNSIGIHGEQFSFYASCYTETLLLLDH